MTHTCKVGDRVVAEFDGELYQGTVTGLRRRRKMQFIVVEFDDGEVHELDPDEVAPCPDDAELDGDTFEPAGDDGGGSGFHVYPVTWSKDRMSFHCDVTIGSGDDAADVGLSDAADKLIGKTFTFSGRYIRTQCFREKGAGQKAVVCWDLEIYARLKTDPSVTYHVECIHYPDDVHNLDDVRADVRERSKDVCFAIRNWIFRKLVPLGIDVAALQAKAAKPMLKCPSLDWLDQLIFKLREARTTACRAGGQRMVVIDTGQPDDPRVVIQLDFTDIAIATDGKPPKEMMGGVIERTRAEGTTRRSKSRDEHKPQVLKPSDESVEALQSTLKALNEAARNGDKQAKSEARRIRNSLRAMGIRGGARAN